MDDVTAAQAAVLTGYSERTIRRKIASGELPARRIASNRYAIDRLDLPQRWDDRNLAHRMDGLERRLQLLEEGQRALFLRLGVGAGEPPAVGPADQSEDSISTLHDLLLQLTQETERLGPLLANAAPDERRQSRLGNGTRSRGKQRSAVGDVARRSEM